MQSGRGGPFFSIEATLLSQGRSGNGWRFYRFLPRYLFNTQAKINDVSRCTTSLTEAFMIDIDEHLNSLVHANTDISDHLIALKKYASRCETITELGTRFGISTAAFLAAMPKSIRCHDLIKYEQIPPLEETAKALGIDFVFFEENDLLSQNIIESDLLFIDTMHTYKQLATELYLHAHKAKKYLVFHDVLSFGRQDQPQFAPHEAERHENSNIFEGDLKDFYLSLGDQKGLMPAIEQFLLAYPEWKVIDLNVFNNGLMVLGRRGYTDVYHGFSNDFLEVNK